MNEIFGAVIGDIAGSTYEAVEATTMKSGFKVPAKNRIKLLNLLNNNGFYLYLVKERCERYAVIDDEIIWYGNINLLSNEHEDESIMRVVSKEIASEILEMTFGNDCSKPVIVQKTLFL